jgi:hypothetical protein
MVKEFKNENEENETDCTYTDKETGSNGTRTDCGTNCTRTGNGEDHAPI